MIRGVVQGADRDPKTLALLLGEFDSYFVKQAPDFFQPILLIFRQWHELSAGNPPDGNPPDGNPPSAADAGGRGQPAARMASSVRMRALLGRMEALC